MSKRCDTCRHFDMARMAPGQDVVKGKKTGIVAMKAPCLHRGGGRFKPDDKCRAWVAKP